MKLDTDDSANGRVAGSAVASGEAADGSATGFQGVRQSGQKWVPEINGYCVGCSHCVDICQVAALDLVWDAAVLRFPDRCTSCGDCIVPCEDDAIHMQWVPMRGDQSTGRWREGPEAAENGSRGARHGVVAWLQKRLGRK